MAHRGRNLKNPYGYIIAGRTRPHAWSATRDFPYKDRTEAKRVLGERVRAMGRRGDDVAFDAFLTEPRGRKIGKTRIRVSPYARNPKGRRKLASRKAKQLQRYHRLYDREYQSAMGFMPFAGSKLDRRHGKTYKPYGRTKITTSDLMPDPTWKRRNPDVRLDWTQRGHSMRDPTGQSEHGMGAWWRTGLKGHEVRKAVKKAHKYASKRKDWTKYGVTVKRNPYFSMIEHFLGVKPEDIPPEGLPWREVVRRQRKQRKSCSRGRIVRGKGRSSGRQTKRRNPIYHYKHRARNAKGQFIKRRR